MRFVPCTVSVSILALIGCSSADPPAPATDASVPADAMPVDAAPADDAAADAAPEAAIDAGRDAGACFECSKASYTCVDDSDGQSFSVDARKNADGSCTFGGGLLACDGTGKAANGSPATWAAGPKVGPSGGPGIHIDYGDLQVNCE